MIFGYARVSTTDQNLDRQIQILEENGCDRVFTEKASGKNRKRPVLSDVLDRVRDGDTLMVVRLSRLGRSVKDLVDIVSELRDKGVIFVSIHDSFNLDGSAMANFIFNTMASLAQLERDITSERTKEGLRAARRKGRVGGRPKGLSKENKRKAKLVATLWKSEEYTISQICDQVGVSKSTLYKYLRTQDIDPQTHQFEKPVKARGKSK